MDWMGIRDRLGSSHGAFHCNGEFAHDSVTVVGRW
jgi:hypothetical protein